MYSFFLSFMGFIGNNNLYCIYLSFEDEYISSTVDLTIAIKFLCNFHTPDLSKDHQVVREHPIYKLL